MTVRLSEQDLDESLIPQIRRLLESGSEVGVKAGHILLDVLGTKAASKLLQRFPESESEGAHQLRTRHEVRPCLSIFAWSDEECELCLQRADLPLHLIFSHARDRIIDPNRSVPTELISRAVAAVKDIDPAKIHVSFFHNRELSLFEELAPFIGAHAAKELAEYVRSVVRSMPNRNLSGQRQLALWIDEIYPVLREAEVSALRLVLGVLRDLEWPELSPTMPVCLEQEAEGFALCGLLPHLASDDRYREMMKRPANTLESAAVYEWLEPASSECSKEMLASLHSASDERSLVRSLWLLGHAKPSITAFDRDRLTELAHSQRPMIRAMVLRFACLSNDEEISRRLIDIGAKYTKPEDQDETYWGTRLLKQYAGSYDFETVFSRINPAAASHILEARGCVAAEALIYARGLDAVWQKAVEGPAASIDILPSIVADYAPDYLGTELPRFDDTDNNSIRFKDSSTSWTCDQDGSLLESFKNWGEATDIQRMRCEHENRVQAILAGWRTDTFALYGRRFSHKALAAVYNVTPEVIVKWIKEVKDEGASRDIYCVRLATFYVDLCEALLNVNPSLGLDLCAALRAAKRLVSFDSMSMVFRAPRSAAVDKARLNELNGCTSDESLSRLAYFSQSSSDNWLRETVENLIGSPFLARKALGLTLAGLAHLDTAVYESYIERAEVGGTWVEDRLDTLRRYHCRDQTARHYYERFLRELDADRSWAAFRVVLRLADRRFHLWRKSSESSNPPPKDRTKLVDISGELKQVTERSGSLNDVLFGIKIKQGEICPFLE